MRICFCGNTASIIWRHFDNLIPGKRIFGHTPNAGPMIADAFPSKFLPSTTDPSVFGTDLSLMKTLGVTPWGIPYNQPVHLLVDRAKRSRTCKGIMLHSIAAEAPRGSILEIQPGMHIVSPELHFIQEARNNDLLSQILLGFELTGCYSLRPDLRTGFTQRHPLCSKESIHGMASAINSSRMTSQALNALSFVQEGSGSPKESGLAIMLSLPHRMGGWGLPAPELNKRINLGKKAASHWGGENAFDMVWEKERLIVEYDGKCHDDEAARRRDTLRRDASILAGYSVYVITKDRLETVDDVEIIAKSIAKILHHQIRVRCKDFPQKNFELWRRVIRNKHA